MKFDQTLSWGLHIRQDIVESTRCVFFSTQFEDWKYATEGGTSFLVNFQSAIYAFTCKHVQKDFRWDQLIVSDIRLGKNESSINSVYFPSELAEDSKDTDAGDIVIIQMNDDINFYRGTAYVLDERTVCQSSQNDNLLIVGCLKSPSKINGNTITTAFRQLIYKDKGLTSDPYLRRAKTNSFDAACENIEGLSGSPVYNTTQNALSGMVVRGGRQELYYIDIFDMMKFLSAVHNNESKLFYKKVLPKS